MRTLILSTLIFAAFSFIGLAQNWFPLEVGNKAHFAKISKYRLDDVSVWVTYSFSFFQITDSIIINSNKYYISNGFFNFPNGTLVRYDLDSCKLFLYKNGIEYLYMDFLLPDNSVLSQIQPDNTFRPITIKSSSEVFLGDTVNLKGFFREAAYPDRYKKGWYYFSPEIGIVKQIEQSDWWVVEVISFNNIEFKYYDGQGNEFHKKHSYSANI